MDVKLFFKLTKYGWINLFYAPILAFLIFIFLEGTSFNVNLSFLILSFFSTFLYVLVAYTKRKIRKSIDFLIVVPLAFLFISCLSNCISLMLGYNSTYILKAILICGGLYGLKYSFENFSSYKLMKKDYFRIQEMMEKKYNPSIIHNLENGSPCEQDIAKEFRRKYAKVNRHD